ncbi:MAG: hypothetical protein LUF29_03075 [Oscillospiraceae bacterium]|nr:hypothetical protein [Oscillospiraceae bacterium]
MDNERKEIMAFLDDLRRAQDVDIYVSSIDDAHTLLLQHMDAGGAKYRRALVEYITDPENRVLSECDVYHNFIMDLFRVKDYDIALKVCDFALEHAPYDRDMLGDAIKACGDSSQFSRGEEYLKRAYEIPFDKWSYRLFLYSIDFLKTKLSAYPLDEELYKKALNLADEYIKNLPFDEHGYNQKAELLVMMNKREEAISELRRYIFDVKPDDKDSKSELITAQCCVTLLNILDNSNDYGFIIRVCDRGLRNTTQEQPSASIGFFVYRKALAFDAKAHSEEFKIPVTVENALKFYQSAYDLNQDRSYSRTIEQRYAVLRPFANDFRPLVKRELYVVEATNNISESE